MLTLRQIAEVSEKVNPRMGEMITGYLDRVNEMMVTQNTLAEEAAEIAEDMSKWARKNKKVPMSYLALCTQQHWPM